KLCFEFG
ncbi:putative Lon protease domain protein, partial [Vibrio parahaemolyticus V-223/04]